MILELKSFWCSLRINIDAIYTAGFLILWYRFFLHKVLDIIMNSMRSLNREPISGRTVSGRWRKLAKCGRGRNISSARGAM